MKKLIAAVCTVSMVMGSISFGAMAEEEMLEITKQPTTANPTVEVNKTEDVSYQWYEADIIEATNIVGNILDEEGNRILVPSKWAQYDEMEGIWDIANDEKEEGEQSCFFVYIDCQPGDVIYVTPQLGADVYVQVEGDNVPEDLEGVSSYQCDYSDFHVIGIWEELIGAGVTVKIELEREGERYVIADGTSTTFNNERCVNSNADYDKEEETWVVSSSGEFYIDRIYLEADTVISFEINRDFSVDAVIGNNDMLDEYDMFEIPSSGEYKYIVPTSASYYIYLEAPSEFCLDIQIVDYEIGQSVVGQTTETLTTGEAGKAYVCRVSCGDEVLWTEYIYGDLAIKTQPTAGNPTVELNYDVDATYQWYNMEVETYEVVDLEDELEELQINITGLWDGEYDDGQWNSTYGCIDIGFNVEKDDKIVVVLPDDFDGEVEEYDYLVDFTYNDGVYEAIIGSNLSWIKLYIYTYSDEDFTAKVYIEKNGISEPIVGENKATLMNSQIGENYFCKVSYEGKELISDIVGMKVDISKQPSLKDLSVGINFVDQVAGYKWYEVLEKSYKVAKRYDTEGMALTSEENDDIIEFYSDFGEYEDGIWTGVEIRDVEEVEGKVIDFYGKLEAGTKLRIALSNDALRYVYIQSYQNRIDEMLNEINDGVFEYVVEATGEYWVGVEVDGDFTAEVSIVKTALGQAVVGQTTSRLTTHEPGTYVCEITLISGIKLYSDFITITENDDVHVYTDMYDPDCNDCGDIRQVPDRPVDPDDGDTGNGDTGNGGTGNGGTGNGGTENSGAGNNGTGNSGAGNNGTGNSGAGNNGTGNSGAGNNGTGNSAAGNNATGNGGAGSNSANKAPNSGDSVNIAWLMAVAVAAMAGSMLVSLKKKRA